MQQPSTLDTRECQALSVTDTHEVFGKINFSYTTEIVGKDPEKANLSHRMRYRRGSLEDLVQLVVTDGHAWCPGIFKSGRRCSSDWSNSELLVLDFDKGLTTPEEVIKCHPLRKGILLSYSTPSDSPEAPRYRVVFRLSRIIRDRREWRLLAERLCLITEQSGYPDNDDGASRDIARFFYGTREEIRPLHQDPQASISPEAILAVPCEVPPPKPPRTSSGSHDNDAEAASKIRLCIENLPTPEPDGGSWYSPFGQTIFGACSHELPQEEALELLEGLWPDYPRQRSLEAELEGWYARNCEDAQDYHLGLGSLISLTRKHLGSYTDSPTLDKKRHNFDEQLRQLQPRGARTSASAAPTQTSGSYAIEPDALGRDSLDVSYESEFLERLLAEAVQLTLDTNADAKTDARLLVVKNQAARLAGGQLAVQQYIRHAVMRRHGFDVTGTGKTAAKARSLKSRRGRASKGTDWLISGWLPRGTSMILYGSAGAGKTKLAMDVCRCLFTGRAFGDSLEPTHVTNKKVLFIGTDGGEGAGDTIAYFTGQMGFNDDSNPFDDDERFNILAADEAMGETAWTLNPRDIERLKILVDSGEFDLVIIDSMEAVAAGTEWDIYKPEFGIATRWIEHIVCPKAALLWLHHDNKSGNTGVHKAKGCTEIASAVSGVTQLASEGPAGEEKYFFNCIKNRRRQPFRFEYDNNSILETGCRPILHDDDPLLERPPTDHLVLVAMLDTEFGRAKTSALYESVDAGKPAMHDALRRLQADKLVRDKARGIWELTTQGKNAARKLKLDRSAVAGYFEV